MKKRSPERELYLVAKQMADVLYLKTISNDRLVKRAVKAMKAMDEKWAKQNEQAKALRNTRHFQ